MSVPSSWIEPRKRRRFAGDAAQQRRFAGAVATEDRNQFAIGDLQRDTVQDVAGAIERVDAIEPQHHSNFPLPR